MPWGVAGGLPACGVAAWGGEGTEGVGSGVKAVASGEDWGRALPKLSNGRFSGTPS